MSAVAARAPAAVYVASGFFVLRTPLLPVEEWLALAVELRAPECDADSGELDAALSADRRLLERRLAELWARPELREAVFLASPSLAQSLTRSPRAPEQELAAEQSLFRYVTRMTTRSTPFGLFAGYSTGRVNGTNELRLGARPSYRRRSRLDMEYVADVSLALERGVASSAKLSFRPNTSLYAVAGRLHYVADRREGRARSYHLVAIEQSDALSAVLERARHGASVPELASALIGPDVSEADARGFLDALIEHRILLSNLEPVLTGPDALEQLLEELDAAEAGETARSLAEVRTEIAQLDRTLAAGPGAYAALTERLAPLAGKVDQRALIQVDLEKPFSAGTLGDNVCRELARGIALLQRLAPSRPDPLAEFRSRFSERYDAEEVPLIEALDAEIGIGFGPSNSRANDEGALAGLPFPARGAAPGEDFGAREATLLRLLEAAWRESRGVLELSDADVEALATKEPRPLPDAVAVMAALLGDPSAERPRLLLHSVTGPSGARMLGRFCARDPELSELVRAHLLAEEALRPEAVFAEIVCHPQDRVGNVLARPLLRGYEIPYLGRSGAPEARQIPVTDLRLRLEGERLVLRSVRLGKEVVPRLSTAHHHADTRNPTLYRFLGALQGQGVAGGLAWDFGPFAGASFLPRVEYQNFVLTRARWNWLAPELEALRAKSGAARHRALRALRERRNMPRHVVLADDDNELVLDLENVLSTDALLERKRAGLTLAEWLPGAEQNVVEGPEGHFVHELVVPFVRRNDSVTSAPPMASGRQVVARRERTFAPGSEWLFTRLYGGEASLDHVLVNVLEPLRKSALAGAAERWFFLRYSDPEPHLRVRFQGSPERLLSEVLPELRSLAQPLIESRALTRIELGTYEREIERYGGLAAVRVAERIFTADSEAALAVVSATLGDEGQAARFRLAIAGMAALFEVFGLELEARAELTERVSAGFEREFESDAALKQALRERFRSERAVLESLLAEPTAAEPAAAALTARTRELLPLVEELRALERQGSLSHPVSELIPSYAHMFVNRVIRSSPRAHEYVFYELLAAHYRSAVGRARAARRRT